MEDFNSRRYKVNRVIKILNAITLVDDKKLCAPLPSPPPSPKNNNSPQPSTNPQPSMNKESISQPLTSDEIKISQPLPNDVMSPSVSNEFIPLIVMADVLYSEFTNLLNKGLRTDAILDLISSNEITISDVFNWLLNNQSKTEYICLLGLLYYYYSPSSQDYDKALSLFFNAGSDYDSVAQNHVGECIGEGVEMNPTEALKWLSRSASNDNVI
ncbi:9503_t:CDS:2, partial [Racocetra persica]